MNIFVLDLDVKLAAQYHPDKLVVKMPTETLQILISTILKHNPNVANVPIAKTSGKPYKKIKNMGHGNRVWAEKSVNNFLWLIELGIALCDEYQFRYHKEHYSLKGILWCKNNVPELPEIPMTNFYLGMPEKYHSDDPVNSYRQYIINDKEYAAWNKTRTTPDWYTNARTNCQV